jgi:CubicO group peptidase (beta-lactamase class C family)
MSYKITRNCLKFRLFAFALLIVQFSSAQTNKKNPKEVGIANFPDLDGVVQKNQKQFGNNLVAMVWTDTLVYKRELGEFDAKTVVPIASASKWLTAALALKMAEEGKISLDDKVSQYLPIFELYGKNYITIRHCLTHFTGIQSEGGIFTKKKFGSLDEEVQSYAKKEIKTNPGTEFSYSEVGFNIVGRILEIVSKKKFDMLIKQQLFNPLAMRKTTFSQLDGSSIDPSSGAQSTAEEYLHFLQMLLNKGQYRGVQILSEEAVNDLRKIQTSPELIKYSPKTGEGLAYAFGSWVIDEGKGGEANALSGAGLYGTWPVVDWCRGYAAVIFTKTLLSEQKKEPYIAVKEAIDEKLPAKCR